MENQNYNCVINANISAAAAVDAINNVAAWWTEDFEGVSQNEGDVFTVRFGTIYKIFKVTEMQPGKRVVWLVTDCYMSWIENKTEWTGTSIVWDVTGDEGSAQINMTHVGLIPEKECYTDCEKGWNYYLKESLLKLVNGQQPKPEKAKVKLID